MKDSDFLWIIKFNPNQQGEADLFIPTPPSFAEKWMKVGDVAENEAEMLDFLSEIRRLCEKIREESQFYDPDNVAEAESYLTKIVDVQNHVLSFEELFEAFQDFLKRLNRHPPDEKE